MEMSGQLHALATLPQDKSTWYLLCRGQGGLHGEEKTYHHCLCWELNPSHRACSLVSVLIELHQLPVSLNLFQFMDCQQLNGIFKYIHVITNSTNTVKS